jgi:fluoride exporter
VASILFVAFLGLVGVVSRYAIDRWLVDWTNPYPMSTFLINMGGCALAGFVYVMSERGAISTHLQTGLLVGFCGGFTTFSAYALQAVQMAERGRVIPALSYILVSPMLGFAAAALPIFLLRRY